MYLQPKILFEKLSSYLNNHIILLSIYVIGKLIGYLVYYIYFIMFEFEFEYKL